MSKEDVINYVMTTPSNPNRAVLSGMLDEVSGTQLPSPTASDNGKVLGVDGGEYKLVEQSGGAVETTVFLILNSSGSQTGQRAVAYKMGKLIVLSFDTMSSFEYGNDKIKIPSSEWLPADIGGVPCVGDLRFQNGSTNVWETVSLRRNGEDTLTLSVFGGGSTNLTKGTKYGVRGYLIYVTA